MKSDRQKSSISCNINNQLIDRLSQNDMLRASQDLHVTSVLSFPNANEKSVLQSLSGDGDKYM